MVDVVAESGCPVCLMHMKGQPKTMQDDPRYDDVVDEVLRFLEERMAFALARGVREEQIMVDPGIGFGKTVEHNLALLDDLRPLRRARSAGRAGRLAQAVPRRDPRRRADGRAIGTVATTVIGYLAGAHVFRVHDVKPNFEALRVALAVLRGRAGP